MPDNLRLALVCVFAAAVGGATALAGSHWLGAPDTAQGERPQSSGSVATAPPNLDQQIRLANLELSQQRLREEIEALRAQAQSLQPSVAQAESVEPSRRTPPRATGVATAASLTAAGVDPQDAEAMVERLDELALARLEADYLVRKADGEAAKQARLERRSIPRDSDVIREEFGDAAFDQYLYSLNQPNRVEVASVLRDSTAQNAGVQNGDFLRSLDGEPLYNVRDLTRRIRDGDAGRSYSLLLERNGEVIETWVPGGPLGVRVNGSVAKPAG